MPFVGQKCRKKIHHQYIITGAQKSQKFKTKNSEEKKKKIRKLLIVLSAFYQKTIKVLILFIIVK